ncbi:MULTISPECIES: acyl-CoA dehydrogenase family protein [Acinetobacter]|uniref:acyl-CoA dehydrogenase family protein n=1 Tax=Acinetobacter TaxID=469 RepID=UPI0015D1C9FC|nr:MULTISPECIES: acyl-CoA dehydrogenase family protein [Acinetobacter]MDM1342529.1 acyl-CoA dehydrogenase family protein [Acinetobacter pseudolwoffii]
MNIKVKEVSNTALSYHEHPEFLALIDSIKTDLAVRDANGEQPPAQIVQYLKSKKIGALRLPKQYGGQALSIEELFAVIIELGRADSDVAHIFHSHFQFTEDVLRHPEPAYREKWFERIASGKIVSNALAEPSSYNVGSGKLITHILYENDQLFLDGKKYFTTGTLHADYVMVFAQSHLDTLCHVVVPTDREGVEVFDDWLGIGQRNTASGTTLFKRVAIFEDEIRWPKPNGLVNKPFAQLYIQAIIAGQTKAVEDRTAVLLANRGRTFSYGNAEQARDEPLFLEKVGEISSIAFIVENAVLRAARSLDRVVQHLNRPNYDAVLQQAATDTAKVKVAIDPLALKAANLMFEVIGASAMGRDTLNDRHWRNIRTLSTHNSVSLKAKVLGDILVNKKTVPNVGYF